MVIRTALCGLRVGGVEGDRPRSGRHGVAGASRSKYTVVPGEENSHMETEEVVEELNENLNADGGSVIGLETNSMINGDAQIMTENIDCNKSSLLEVDQQRKSGKVVIECS
nr:hypothetical protein CFP56_20150 [Quercus suber]